MLTTRASARVTVDLLSDALFRFGGGRRQRIVGPDLQWKQPHNWTTSRRIGGCFSSSFTSQATSPIATPTCKINHFRKLTVRSNSSKNDEGEGDEAEGARKAAPILRVLPPNFNKEVPVDFIDAVRGNAISCYPLWMIDDTLRNGKEYIVGKPVHRPVALYFQDSHQSEAGETPNEEDEDDNHSDPSSLPKFSQDPKYVDGTDPFLDEILPILEEQLFYRHKDKYRLHRTPQTLTLEGPLEEDFGGYEEFETVLQLTLQESGDDNGAMVDDDDNNSDLTSNSVRQNRGPYFRHLWLIRPLYPILHIAHWHGREKCALISIPDCMDLIPRVQTGHAERFLTEDEDFTRHGTVNFLFAGQGIVGGVNNDDNDKSDDK